MKKPFVIGVSGGSGSGKTTLAEALRNHFGSDRISLILQDSYYIDQSEKFDKCGGAVNFDHPDSLEFSLLATHLKDLKQSKTVKLPVYDFKTHKRTPNVQALRPHEIILVDGILILSQLEIVKELDYAIFVDTPEKVRFERRLRRDTIERGRTPEGVRAQFVNQVKPMHDLFVEASKLAAHLVVSGLEPIENLKMQVLKGLGSFGDRH